MAESCEWMTGFPKKFYDFLVTFETNGGAVEFYSDAPIEVDWGSGSYSSYEAGVVHGYQTKTNSNAPVVVRASESVTAFRFGSGVDYDNSYLECHIHKAPDLLTAEKLCYRLESMTKFSFFGTNKVQSFESAWEDCTELIEFNGMDTIEATSFKKAWKNCQKLVGFPSVYSRVANTMEEAWMGCTSMQEFPIIGSENCTSLRNAWKGNVALTDFPLIDTSSVQDFYGAWSYCVSLVSFPALDYSSATNMDYTFAYNYKIKSMPIINASLSLSFISTFERCLALECISGINSTSTEDSTDMFNDCCALTNPNESEQTLIINGYDYTNLNKCYFDAGRSVFFVQTATTAISDDETCSGDIVCSFEVIGNDCEVDWGDGVWLPYNEGTITGVPVKTGIVNIRSEEDVTSIKFLTDTYTAISFKRTKTVTTLEESMMGLTNLETVDSVGVTSSIANMNSAFEGCTGLLSASGFDYSGVLSMVKTFKGCTSLTWGGTGSFDVSSCTDFTSIMEGCTSLLGLPTLITTVGEVFDNAFKDCSGLKCVTSIDTRNQTSTTNAFDGCINLVRPNLNEQADILAGSLYSNNGNCDVPFSMSFQGTGSEVRFTTDVDVQVDWGNGTYVTESAGQVIGTPSVSDVVYVNGEVSSLSFDTDTFHSVTIHAADYFTSMEDIMLNKTNLDYFYFYATAPITTWESAFEGCTNLISFEAYDYTYATTFTNMFKGCTALENVGAMNTVSGTEFEYMFANCTSLDLTEINTLLGNFAKKYINCIPATYDCTTGTLVCDPMHTGGPDDDVYQCSNKLVCDPGVSGTDDHYACFGTATMFDGWGAGQTPSESDRIAIMSQAHWKDGEIL